MITCMHSDSRAVFVFSSSLFGNQYCASREEKNSCILYVDEINVN